MRLDPETRRRSILPLLAVSLVAGYLFVFLPLDRRAGSLDAPLDKSWRRLAAALGHTNAFSLDFVSLTNQFNETRAAFTVFKTVRQQARSRVELDGALRDKLSSPFLLVDYKDEISGLKTTLARLAKQQSVGLESNVFAGFPEQTIDMTEPAMLWAELAFLDTLLTTAINAKVTTIHSVAAPLPLTNTPSLNGGRSFVEVPVQIELTGLIQNVARILQALPLRASEVKAAGLPEASTNKPVLFIDRLVLRKQSPEKLDEVRASLRFVGFVFRE